MRKYFLTDNEDKNSPPSTNLNITKAIDSFIYEGTKKFLDLRSGLWNVGLGYKKELYLKVEDEFSCILRKGIPYIDINSYNNDTYNIYSEKLLNFVNNDNDFITMAYTNSGSEGIEMAVKISHDYARTQNKKDNKIMIFKNSYHGTFFGSMSVSHKFFDLEHSYETVNPVILCDVPHNELDLLKIKKTLLKMKNEITSFILEPILGSGGSIEIDKSFLEEIIKMCKENNILVFFDEVSTGFYRSGDKFAFSSLKEKPNAVILSKSLNNGILPFGAILIDSYIDNLLNIQNINHFSTQTGNMLAIASANVTLDFYMSNEKAIEKNVKKINEIIMRKSQLSNIKVNGRGAMFSIPLKSITITRRFKSELQKMGIVVYSFENTDGTSGITLYPNLLIEESLWEKSIEVIVRKIKLGELNI